MVHKVFTTGNAGNRETEYRLYIDGNRIETRYDNSGDNYRNLKNENYVHGYTTAQVRKAQEEFDYWKKLLKEMKNAPIVEDDEAFLGESDTDW